MDEHHAPFIFPFHRFHARHANYLHDHSLPLQYRKQIQETHPPFPLTRYMDDAERAACLRQLQLHICRKLLSPLRTIPL